MATDTAEIVSIQLVDIQGSRCVLVAVVGPDEVHFRLGGVAGEKVGVAARSSFAEWVNRPSAPYRFGRLHFVFTSGARIAVTVTPDTALPVHDGLIAEATVWMLRTAVAAAGPSR